MFSSSGLSGGGSVAVGLCCIEGSGLESAFYLAQPGVFRPGVSERRQAYDRDPIALPAGGEPARAVRAERQPGDMPTELCLGRQVRGPLEFHSALLTPVLLTHTRGQSN